MPNGNVIFSKNMREAIGILNDQEIGLVVLKINNNKDASILKYINDYYKNLEVLVMASKEYDEVISTFSTGHFKLYSQPLKLAELKTVLKPSLKPGFTMGKMMQCQTPLTIIKIEQSRYTLTIDN
jgi:DNA-binding NtrC family response regulator